MVKRLLVVFMPNITTTHAITYTNEITEENCPQSLMQVEQLTNILIFAVAIVVKFV